MIARSVLVTLIVTAGSALAPTARAIDLLEPSDPFATAACATSVATGDVNDDGRADVVLGCPGETASAQADAGLALVFLRNTANTGFATPVPLISPAPHATAACGQTVATGDVNGDGRDDIAIGCDGDNPGSASNAGDVVLFRRNGGNTGFEAGTVLSAASPQANEKCGSGIAMGDFSGDGRADIATGCEAYNPGGKTNAGRVVTFSGVALTAGSLASGTTALGDRCGTDVAIGDLTGSQTKDVIAGCSGSGVKGAVVFTDATGTGTEYTPSTANTQCGTSIAVGDVNEDGRADLAIGCPSTTVPAGPFSGAATLLVNNGSGFDTPRWFYPPSPTNNDRCGASVSIGHVTGFGGADVAVGCSEDDGIGGAILYQRVQSSDGFTSGGLNFHPTAAADDKCGYATAIGDVDGDTGGDLVVGCYGRAVSALAGAGSAFAIHGTPLPQPGPPTQQPIDPAIVPDPPPPPTPDAPVPTTPNSDKTPTSVSVGFPTIPAIPVNPDGSYNSPQVACGETQCTIVVDPGTKGYSARFGFGAFATATIKPFSVGARKTYTLTQGKKGSTKLKLNTKAKALLKKRKKLIVTFNIQVTDPSKNVKVFRKNATLKPAKAKRK